MYRLMEKNGKELHLISCVGIVGNDGCVGEWAEINGTSFGCSAESQAL